MTKTTLPPKVDALYMAVDCLLKEGADVSSITVAEITGKAGIGKGTAYEYFENKEELIASALIYKVSELCRQLEEKLVKYESFREKVLFLLKFMEEKRCEQTSFLKVVNIVTDNSSIGNQIRKILKNKDEDSCMPQKILALLVKSAMNEGKFPVNVPYSYMELSISSKLLAYGLYILRPPEKRDCEPEVMRKLICEGLCTDIGY